MCPIKPGFALFLMMMAFTAVAAPRYSDAIEKTDNGHSIILTEEARDHIAGDGLLTILYQAASTPMLTIDGDIYGFRLTDIDQGSIFDLAGLKDGDIVTHIDGEALFSPERALDLLRYVKGQPSFTYQVKRPAANGYVVEKYSVRIGSN